MPYIGKEPANSFISFEKQVFTIVNSQTAYTLDNAVTNENDIRLVINNIVQEPGSGKAYTASGTTLTLSAALVNGTDEMYCVFLGRATATNAPGAGSVGTSQLAADAVTGAKIADDAISDEHLDPTAITGQTAETSIASDDLILLSDTSASGALKKMTQANFVSGVGGNNTPAFAARRNSDQSISNNAETKIACDQEVFDTDSAYDNSSNYRFTPGVAGKYNLYSQVGAYGISAASQSFAISIYKNGSDYIQQRQAYSSNAIESGGTYALYTSGTVDVSASDYFEVYLRVNSNATNVRIDYNATNLYTFFGAYRIIGV